MTPIGMLRDGSWFRIVWDADRWWPRGTVTCIGQKMRGDSSLGVVKVRYVERWGKPSKEEQDISAGADVTPCDAPQEDLVVPAACVPMGMELAPQEVPADPFE